MSMPFGRIGTEEKYMYYPHPTTRNSPILNRLVRLEIRGIFARDTVFRYGTKILTMMIHTLSKK
ncbi:hypothetical protein ZHAS_00007980 [Anopheles sinensis]|uniref:Uncharacterized protein n=1 Tax=Anopheles sinensis TaxID=74873 RepID=A0A084VR98_ANOSI|nr:hypothetical protein ZHAS_00007980 [Anopheles sinensis]